MLGIDGGKAFTGADNGGGVIFNGDLIIGAGGDNSVQTGTNLGGGYVNGSIIFVARRRQLRLHPCHPVNGCSASMLSLLRARTTSAILRVTWSLV